MATRRASENASYAAGCIRPIRSGGTNASTNRNATTRVCNGVGGQKVAGAFQPEGNKIEQGKEEPL